MAILAIRCRWYQLPVLCRGLGGSGVGSGICWYRVVHTGLYISHSRGAVLAGKLETMNLIFWRKNKQEVQEAQEAQEEYHYLPQIIVCSCGVFIPTKEGLEKHRKLGHFDLPKFELTEEQKKQIRNIIRQHRRLSIGRSGRNDKDETGCEAYYFSFADGICPRTPTLYWNDDPNITSAFVSTAYEYADSIC